MTKKHTTLLFAKVRIILPCENDLNAVVKGRRLPDEEGLTPAKHPKRILR